MRVGCGNGRFVNKEEGKTGKIEYVRNSGQEGGKGCISELGMAGLWRTSGW